MVLNLDMKILNRNLDYVVNRQWSNGGEQLIQFGQDSKDIILNLDKSAWKRNHDDMLELECHLGIIMILTMKIVVAWEHEQFSRLRVTAATLSELSVAPELLERTGGLSDSRLCSGT
ncbi:hypothetical protein CK203_085353 [Vitis vinifera]|uniref:Uncharacterized protein n=1 Tax=Vitis vinifera TaxID=29760 RepID=A0A438DCZ0_VITVI|nr:hypothetical protein CK203_085353 [Vitis vinifera]